MRTLFQLISKYHFVLLFLLLELISLSLLVRYNSIQRTSFISSSGNVFGSIYASYSEVSDYFGLREKNKALAEQNSQLLNANKLAYTRVFGDRVLINDTLYHQQYSFIAANVVNITTNKQKNYITISSGKLDGVEIGMGVMSATGIVGIVNNVSAHYATILPVIHIDSKISVKLQKGESFGSLTWQGKSPQKGMLVDIPNYAAVQEGAQIITSGFSAVFPKGLKVGKVSEVIAPEGQNFYELEVAFDTDFSALSQVYVIKNYLKTEQKEIESALDHGSPE